MFGSGILEARHSTMLGLNQQAQNIGNGGIPDKVGFGSVDNLIGVLEVFMA